MAKLKGIFAIGIAGEFGINNKLLEHIPEDLVNFKKETLNKTVIMGSNTWKSLPKKLPDRKTIVLTKKTPTSKKGEFPDVIFNCFEDLCGYINKRKNEEFIIIGGKQIIELFEEEFDELIITSIPNTYPTADTILDLEFLKNYKLKSTKKIKTTNENFDYIYVKELERKAP